MLFFYLHNCVNAMLIKKDIIYEYWQVHKWDLSCWPKQIQFCHNLVELFLRCMYYVWNQLLNQYWQTQMPNKPLNQSYQEHRKIQQMCDIQLIMILMILLLSFLKHLIWQEILQFVRRYQSRLFLGFPFSLSFVGVRQYWFLIFYQEKAEWIVLLHAIICYLCCIAGNWCFLLSFYNTLFNIQLEQ